jgi:hypothetical protein
MTRFLSESLQHISAEGELIAGLAHLLRENEKGKLCFALKQSRFKALLKKSVPKRVMKQLGYRSIDSLLRHESPALILTAAQFVESKSWWHDLLAQYKRFTSQDFEMRPLAVLHPDSARWRELASGVVAHRKHNVYGFKELGAVVLLPLPKDAPAGSAMASLILSLQALNDIRSGSSYLQLCQVRADFGTLVDSVATREVELQTHLFDQAVPWQLIQRSLAHLPEALHQELIEPDMQLPDIAWQSLGHALHQIEPSLRFWHGSEHLGLLHEGRAVSMHALDVALNVCNSVPFERRIVRYFQQSLWHELLMRYLQPQTIEHTLLTALQPQLAPAFANN